MTQDATRDAQEVRTVWTSELGVARPTGLAYDPVRRELLVSGDQGAGTRVLRLGPDENARGRPGFATSPAQETLTFDTRRKELTAVDGAERVEVPAGDLTRARPSTTRAPIDDLQLEAPASAAIDPQTDTWFLLDEDARHVLAVAEHPVDRIDAAASAIVTGASGPTLAIPGPPGCRPGTCCWRRSGTAPPHVDAAGGWTEVATIARSTAHHGVYYKVAGAG